MFVQVLRIFIFLKIQFESFTNLTVDNIFCVSFKEIKEYTYIRLTNNFKLAFAYFCSIKNVLRILLLQGNIIFI